MEAIELRDVATCVACTAPLPVGARVWRDLSTRHVTCMRCNPVDDRRSARRPPTDPVRDGASVLRSSGPNPVLADGGGRPAGAGPLGVDPRPPDDPSGGSTRPEERTRRVGRIARRLRRG